MAKYKRRKRPEQDEDLSQNERPGSLLDADAQLEVLDGEFAVVILLGAGPVGGFKVAAVIRSADVRAGDGERAGL
jgi:hypothetical protein